jgi:hypothetical protein|tara:strand:- start:99 stop:305 length:207 start_codon:yes stop_codon:yes gene_type:complete
MELTAKVTIQTTDVTSPVVNTTIYEVEDIPLEEKELRNLIGFLIEAKNGPFEKSDIKEKPDIVTDTKS